MVSVNEREGDVRAAVQRVESFNESSPDLDDVNPQQQELENHHRLRQRTPTTSKCEQKLAKVIECLGLVFGINTTSDLSKLLTIFRIL